MSSKAKAAVVVIAIVAVVAVMIFWARPGPATPNSPVPLRELIEKSDLVVYARVLKIETPSAPLASSTNRWAEKARSLLPKREKPMAIAHLGVMQTVKGRPVEKVIVNVPATVTYPPPRLDRDSGHVLAFLSRQGGEYRPVAFKYGTKVVSRRQADILLRWISEFVATDKLAQPERETERDDWLVRLIEDPEWRWDGAASWMDLEKPGEAVKKLPPNLAKRIEAVAFREEPLAAGDELLLRELAVARPKEATRRLLSYFQLAAQPGPLPQPWRCYGAMELLIQIAGMPATFRNEFVKAPYPDFSSSHARAGFIRTYLPAIEARLKEKALVD